MARKKDPVREKTSSEPTANPDERYRMVAEAAYFKSEKRGFRGGDPAADWLEAEAELASSLGERESRSRRGKTRSESAQCVAQ